MKVLKFGGTSVGTVNSLQHVKSIVESCDEQVVVVVSALGGITDKLISTAQMASQGDGNFMQQYDEIVRRHDDVINGMVPAEKLQEVRSIVDPLLEEL
jgi:aspartokinase/homoserine dehydrogenase 1